jgi:hypothetical protein
MGEDGLHLQWPQPGDYWRCTDGQVHRIIRIVLTVAHLDHTPENCCDDNLKALYQRCHNRYDAAMRRAGVRKRAREKCALGELV